MIQDDASDGLLKWMGHGDRAPQVPDGPVLRGLGPQTNKRIGMHLRAMYDQIVQQPIPDRFQNLIDRLDDPPSLGEIRRNG